jgi:hypothetical protein
VAALTAHLIVDVRVRLLAPKSGQTLVDVETTHDDERFPLGGHPRGVHPEIAYRISEQAHEAMTRLRPVLEEGGLA